MKRAAFPSACVLLAIMMTVSIISCGGSDETTSPEIIRYLVTDLQGTWYLNTVSTNNTGAAGDSYYGQMVVSSGGNIASGEYFNYPTGPLAYGELLFTGGSLHLAPDTGVPGGTINTTSGPFIIDSGKMDPSKFAMIFNSNKSALSTQFDLTVAFKGGGSYVSSDLSGTWFLFGLCSRPADTGSVRGFMVIDNSGGITGSFVLGGGTAFPINSGSAAFISSTTPVFTGDFLTLGPVTRTIVNGIMDHSKTFASFNSIVTPDGGLTISESEIVVMIKETGSFTTSDLAGTWYIAGASAGNTDPADDGAIAGNLVMNSTGTVTGGTLTLPGASSAITGGSMTVTAAGALAGTITTGVGNIVFTNGRLDASKKKMAFTDTNTVPFPDEEKRLFILFK